MLRRITTLVSEDFPEYEVDIRRPGPEDWGDFQDACVNGNPLDGMFNMLIATGTVHRIENGARVAGATVPRIGNLCDEWSTLVESACGAAGMLCGVFSDGVNAQQLDLPAILAAAEKTLAIASGAVGKIDDITSADLALAKLAERCGAYGLTADLMRVTIASHPRRGSYSAYLVDDIGAFVFERPKFTAWAAYDRRQRREKLAACVDLVSTCTAFPDRGMVATLVADLPGFVTTAADEIRKLRNDVRSDVKKESTLSDSQAPTGSPLPVR